MKNNYSTEAKLSLILTSLGFVNITLLQGLGLMIGFFLTTIGLYIAEEKIRIHTNKNELANVSVYLATASYTFIGALGILYSYLTILK